MATRVMIVGDVHGKLRRFQSLIDQEQPEHLIQLGDFGFRKEHDWFLSHFDPTTHHILFGNHDYIPYLNKPHSLGDWSQPYEGIFTIRGADSIDQRYRTPGVNWWHNEEMSYLEWNDCIAAYAAAKPRIVLSHDSPQLIRRKTFGIHDTSRTSLGLQRCLEIHQPRLWIFGHHHSSVRRKYGETRFVGLNELESICIEVETERVKMNGP